MDQTRAYENVYLKKHPYKRRGKRIVSDKNAFYVKIIAAVLLFTFLLPYIITSFFGNINDTEIKTPTARLLLSWEEAQARGNIYIENISFAGREVIPLDIYLIDKLARSINTAYHPETLKAQAVLLRTALAEELWNEYGNFHGNNIHGNISGTIQITDPGYGQSPVTEEVIMAVTSTQNIILTYQDIPAKTAYFAVSNGRTRDSSEVFINTDFPYLKPVECNRDFLAENFTSQKTISKNEFFSAVERAVQTKIPNHLPLSDIHINRDSGNYIIDITFDTAPSPITLSGEECRLIWGLNSSSFTIEESGNRIIFSVRGIGHGLGMSQFAANEMAMGGHDYISILEHFFSGTMLTKFE